MRKLSNFQISFALRCLGDDIFIFMHVSGEMMRQPLFALNRIRIYPCEKYFSAAEGPRVMTTSERRE